jgi:hypothetical protein
MTNPYIQNAIISKQPVPAAPVVASNQQITKKSVLTPYVRPDSPKGYLIDENLIQGTVSSVKETARPFKYFYNAVVKGEGDDYRVGRVHDAATLGGSVAIAASVASHQKDPKAKVMEFVGLATWFGAMSAWPKVFGKGVEMATGVPLNKEYVDSYGRRKQVFQDNQFVPWNLYQERKPELYAMGDKLGVPKNIKRREEAIQAKAQQVAVQANTWMMITAGVATPVITALTCNFLEKPVEKMLEKYRVNKSLKALEPLKMDAKKLLEASDKKKADEELLKILGSGEDTVHLTPDSKEALTKHIEERYMHSGVSDGLKKAVEELVPDSKMGVHITPEVSKSLHSSLALNDETLKALGITNEKHISSVKSAIAEITPEHFNEMLAQAGNLNEHCSEGLSSVISANLSDKLLSIKGLGVNKAVKVCNELDKNLMNGLNQNRGIPVSKQNANVIRKLLSTADDYVERNKLVDGYRTTTIKDVADSMTANHWGNLQQRYVKAFDFSKEQLDMIASKTEIPENLIHNHLLALASDTTPEGQERFKKVCNSVADITLEVTKREEMAKQKLLSTGFIKGAHDMAKDASIAHAENMGKELNAESAFRDLIKDMNTHTSRQITADANKIFSTRSTCFRTLQVLNVYKKYAGIPDSAEGESDPKKLKQIAEAKTARAFVLKKLNIDNLANKAEEFGKLSEKELEELYGNTFTALKELPLEGKNIGFKYKASGHHELMKFSLGQLPNEINDKKLFKEQIEAQIKKRVDKIEQFNKVKKIEVKDGKGEVIATSENKKDVLIKEFKDRIKNSKGFTLAEQHKEIQHKFKIAKSRVILLEKFEAKKELLTKQIDLEQNSGLKSQLKKQCEKVNKSIDRLTKNTIFNKELNKVVMHEKVYQRYYKHVSLVDKCVANIKSMKNPKICDETDKVGKNFSELVKDGISAMKISNTWLARVGMIAVPLTALSLFAVSQFGKKNEYNQDIYEAKKN